jgi:segregation and condensation protein A
MENTETSTIQKSNYVVKTEYFEGPLDVLLTLIEKRKLLINQVSLSMVTEEFMRYIESIQDAIYIKEKTHFVAIASILILIKARSLLPTLVITEEETEDIADLERRLKILEFIRAVSKKIEAVYGKKVIYNQGDFKRDICVFAPSKDISIANIEEASKRVLLKLPKEEKKLAEVKVRRVMSIEEMMYTLSTRIQQAVKTTFAQFSKSGTVYTDVKEQKQHVVVSFLALLELVKQNMVQVEQHAMFEDIEVESVGVMTVPEYK